MKMKPAKIATTLTILACVGAASLFQNCSKIAVSDITDDPPAESTGQQDPPTDVDPDPNDPNNPGGGGPGSPSIQIVANPTNVLEGQRTNVTVTFRDVQNVTYSCNDTANPTVVASGSIPTSGQNVSVQIDFDVHCEVKGTTTAGQEIKASADVTVNCANRMKNPTTNRCEDFKCDAAKAQILAKPAPGQVLQIPARTSEGVCYYVKLLDAVGNSASSLTPTKDAEVLSRNHNQGYGNPSDIHQPYSLGKTDLDFLLAGPRVVKLSGSLNPDQKILVDNFILFGIFPSGQDVSGKLSQVYKSMGSRDSTIANSAGTDTGAVSFRNTLIPLQSFKDGGTSSIDAVDLSTSAEAMILQKLDFRALDCGGSRELSDIYLVFQ